MRNREKFEPRYEQETSKEELEKQKFLEFEKLTQPNEEIKKIAGSFRGEEEQQTVENILSFLGNKENLEHIDLERKNKKEWKKLFNKRTAEEIFETKNSYGCTDTTTIFISIARECGIPAKFIEGKRLEKSGTHSWARVFVGGKWIDVDPTQGVKGTEFKPEESKHGPYKVISESLGPSDSLISSYEGWRKVEKMWDYEKNDFKDKFKKETKEKKIKVSSTEEDLGKAKDLEIARKELKEEFQKVENGGEGSEKEV